MSNYTQSDNSILGSSYMQGLIKPWDEYIAFSTSDTVSYLLIGEYSGREGDVITFEDSKLYRVSRTYSGSYTYETSIITEDQTTVTVAEPYYVYSNTFDGAPVLNVIQAPAVTSYFVVFCCILSIFSHLILNVIKSVIRRIWL